MKVLLYFEGQKLISTSGIGRALKHQQLALKMVNVETTTNPSDNYDILHINTVGLTSSTIINQAKEKNIPVIYHAHSTEEDFRNSFILSNQLSPIFKKHLVALYSQADYILTPTPYSKSLLENYGITIPIEDISNGIDLKRFDYNEEKIKAFRKYFNLNDNDKVVIGVGLYFERKGILDFVEVAKSLPEYKFIWFGHTPLYSIPKNVRQVIEDYPRNVFFPGYVKGPIIEGAYAGANCFFFPSYEETEGIVVLEALASYQSIVVRDIGVFNGWLIDNVNCYKGHNNQEFKDLIIKAVEQPDENMRQNGRNCAKERSLENVGIKLKGIYEKVLKMHGKQN